MEPRFGHDFSQVRVHTDAVAAESAKLIGASAYTFGQHVVFGPGGFDPGSEAGRNLISHELAHTIQQQGAGSPGTAEGPAREHEADHAARQVANGRHAGRLTRSGLAVACQLSEEIPRTPEEIDQQIAWISMALLSLIQPMRPLLLYRLQQLQRVRQSFGPLAETRMQAAIASARAKFRARHSGHGDQVLDHIDAALERVTRNNPDLRFAYYDYYSDHKLTDDLVNPGNQLGDSGLRFWTGIFTDLNRGMLHLEPLPKAPTDDPLSLLGGTLIHEYAHQSHLSNPLKGPTEGKAYGIEQFFAERMGDTKRAAATEVLGPKKGDKTAYDTSYRVMSALYKVIDTGKPDSINLKGISSVRAREMTVEFISKNQSDFSNELRRFIAAEFNAPEGLGSLP